MREFIQVWCDKEHPLLAWTEAGHLSAEQLGCYLGSLSYLFATSEACIRKHAEAPGRLQAFYQERVKEEDGHAEWAEDDLNRYRLEDRVMPAAKKLARFISTLTAEEFLAYACWAEYMTVLIGQRWLDALKTSGFDQIDAVSKHMDADAQHSEEGLALVESRQVWVVERACQRFDEFEREIVALG